MRWSGWVRSVVNAPGYIRPQGSEEVAATLEVRS
jgi:hypothetical protein